MGKKLDVAGSRGRIIQAIISGWERGGGGGEESEDGDSHRFLPKQSPIPQPASPNPPKTFTPPSLGPGEDFWVPHGGGGAGGAGGTQPWGVFVWFYFDFWEEFWVFLSQFQGSSAD